MKKQDKFTIVVVRFTFMVGIIDFVVGSFWAGIFLELLVLINIVLMAYNHHLSVEIERSERLYKNLLVVYYNLNNPLSLIGSRWGVLCLASEPSRFAKEGRSCAQGKIFTIY